uniref:flavodoxin family protein n=2 Tax=Roseivirga sp. TaxID=1964215 RepID=UPI004048B4B3
MSNSSILLIAGSSRNNGNTIALTTWLAERLSVEFTNLNDFNISYYDYEHKNIDDDFLSIAQKMVESETIVLISPVYWYAVSAQMKTFIDRISDLVTIRKDMGRKLRGKNLVLVSNGASLDAGEAFELPLKQTAEYLEMHFGGHFHFMIEKVSDLALKHSVSLDDLLSQLKEIGSTH